MAHSTAPGLMRRGDQPDVIMMICTAGHVDHGKTRLVGLLTGCATDRLREEKERGLTIELGFAPCMLGGRLCVGIVDVPGHEKFIKNMVAGVSGIDLAVLVVAADDGVMPQTVEHVHIMELMGIPTGMVALTKTDLVDAARVEAVSEEISVFLEGSFLSTAPIYPVSSETGEGVMEFYEGLVSRIEGLKRHTRSGVFRMPVERVFVQKGFGVVVTGIPLAGTIRTGDTIEVVPGGLRGRVRGIQRFLADADEGGYGQCLALNLADIDHEQLERGQMVCLPDMLSESRLIHGRIRTAPDVEPPLRHGEEVKLHIGTSETPGKVFLLEERVAAPNHEVLGSVIVERPVAAAAHDRFLLRRPSPASTIAGGEVFEHAASPKRPRNRDLAERLHSYVDHLGDMPRTDPRFADRRLTHYLGCVERGGGTPDAIARALLEPVAVVQARLDALAESGQIIALSGNHYMDPDAFAKAVLGLRGLIDGPEVKGLTLSMAALRKQFPWPEPVWRAALKALAGEGAVDIRGDRLLRRKAAAALSKEERDGLDRILAIYDETGFQSPRPEELPERLNAPPKAVQKVLDLLYHQGELIRVSKNVALSRAHYRKAQDMVIRIIQERGQLDSADFKNDIGSSRKYALAILDDLDARNITVRNGNYRRLAPQYESRLVR